MKDVQNGLFMMFAVGEGVSTLWFFYCLFWCEVLFYIMYKKFGKRRNGYLSVVTYLIGIVLFVLKIELPLGMDMVLIAIGFYAAGFYYKRYIETKVEYNIVLLFVLFVVLSGLSFAIYRTGNWDIAKHFCACPCLGTLTAVTGTLVVIDMAHIIEKKSWKVKKIFEGFGRESLWIYPLSSMFPALYKDIFHKMNMDSVWENKIGKALMFLICWVFIYVTILVVKQVKKTVYFGR